MCLVPIIICAGLFGGLANFLETAIDSDRDSEKTSKKGWQRFARCTVLGVSASFCVPLFLTVIQSDLIRKEPYDHNTLLVFFGFCILAAFFSRRFIDTVGEKALRLAKEAKEESKTVKSEVAEVKEDVKVALDQSSEQKPLDLESAQQTDEATLSIDDKMKRVLQALASPRYTFRSIAGIVAESGLSESEVAGYLSWLKRNKLTNQSKREHGWRWYITARGRSYIQNAEPPKNLFSEP